MIQYKTLQIQRECVKDVHHQKSHEILFAYIPKKNNINIQWDYGEANKSKQIFVHYLG